MEIRREDIVIRDIRPSDIADHLRWRTVETEWMNWDAPWQQDPSLPVPAIERRLRELASAPLPAVRTRFEIALSSGEHIGWMNSYLVDGQPGCTAIGIDIPDPRLRGCGRGERAFSAFIHYLFSAGLPCVYTETWSGNLPMIRLAGKCGFSLVQRGRQDRLVDGRPYDSLLFCVTPGDFYEKQTFEPTPNLKKPLSRCGWALFALILCAQVGAFPLALLLQRLFPGFLHSAAGPFALSAFALYGLGLGAFALVLRRRRSNGRAAAFCSGFSSSVWAWGTWASWRAARSSPFWKNCWDTATPTPLTAFWAGRIQPSFSCSPSFSPRFLKS